MRTPRSLAAACLFALVLALVPAGPAAAGSATIFRGSMANVGLNQPIVGISSTPSAAGYWLVGRDGGIFSFGDARYHGSTGAIRLNQPIVGMARTISGNGYWLVAADGGVFAFGDARYYGSTGAKRLNQPIVGMARTSSGRGYWLVARDGGIFSFGDARFKGSTGAIRLAQPIVGMTSTPRSGGYWLVAADGGVFAFGTARYHGTTAGKALGGSIVSLLRSPSGNGYVLVGADGAAHRFGDATTRGSVGAPLSPPVVGAAGNGNDQGYWMTTANGLVLAFGAETRALPPGVHTSATAPDDRNGAIAREVFARVNAERRVRGLAPLLWDDDLAAMAAGWSAEMARSGFRHSSMSHAMASRPQYHAMGENIYAGGGSYADAGSAHSAWMLSDGHRKNVVQPGYSVVGIGVYCDAGGTMWITQDFGAHNAHGQPAMASSVPGSPIASLQDGGNHC
jgi:uncharacterized protein YkwD